MTSTTENKAYDVKLILEHDSLQSRTEHDQALFDKMEEQTVPEAVELNKCTMQQMEGVRSEHCDPFGGAEVDAGHVRRRHKTNAARGDELEISVCWTLSASRRSADFHKNQEIPFGVCCFVTDQLIMHVRLISGVASE